MDKNFDSEQFENIESNDHSESNEIEKIEEEKIITKSYVVEEISINSNFTCLHYNKSKQLLATGDSKGRISIWDYRTKKKYNNL